MYKLIKDKNILRGVCEKYNLQLDNTHTNIIQNDSIDSSIPITYKGNIYWLNHCVGSTRSCLTENVE